MLIIFCKVQGATSTTLLITGARIEILIRRKKIAFQRFHLRASDENRTHVCSLEGCRSTIELHSQDGVSEGNRTLDPLIKSQLLYHLSYRNIDGGKKIGWGSEDRTHDEGVKVPCLTAWLCPNRPPSSVSKMIRIKPNNGGDGWFRTTEPRGSRFTVCRVQPLRYVSIK